MQTPTPKTTEEPTKQPTPSPADIQAYSHANTKPTEKLKPTKKTAAKPTQKTTETPICKGEGNGKRYGNYFKGKEKDTTNTPKGKKRDTTTTREKAVKTLYTWRLFSQMQIQAQILSPVFFMVHECGYKLWRTISDPTSDELEILAQDGDAAPLEEYHGSYKRERRL
ncbi:hypothetical protein ACA910_013875 [Epithemia clementina (nom. ined.)]